MKALVFASALLLTLVSSYGSSEHWCHNESAGWAYVRVIIKDGASAPGWGAIGEPHAAYGTWTWTYTYMGASYNGLYVFYRWGTNDPVSAGTCLLQESFPVSAGVTRTDSYFSGGGPTYTYYRCTYSLSWHNGTGKTQRVAPFVDGQQLSWDVSQQFNNPYIGVYQEAYDVYPGTSFSQTLSFDRGTNSAACPTVVLRDLNSQVSENFNGTQESRSTPWGGDSFSNPSSTAGGVVGNENVPYATNGAAATGGDINRAADALLRGFGGILEALKTKAEENTLRGATNQLGSQIALAQVSTNLAGQTASKLTALTNQFGTLTNQLGSVSNTMVGVSNLLSSRNTAGSNYVYSGSQTNFSSATNAGSSAASAALTGFDSAVSSLGSAPTGLNGAGDGAGLTMTFCGQSLNFNPDNAVFPGFMAIIKAAWTFVSIFVFCYSVGVLLFEVSKTYAGAQSGGVPNLEISVLGSGGNFAGLAVALAVAAVLISVWVLIFTALFTAVSSSLGLLPAASSALGLGGNAVALYLLNQAVPIQLILSLAFTRLVLQFTAAKLVVICSSASRFLIGR